ncbi:MAG: hypothetical protein HON23_02860 [Rickettsiales bacterium]|jgi:hypothetical protein|nr:hypothetical protein [Rickettsiales bacterium]
MIKPTLILTLLLTTSCTGSRIKDTYSTTIYTKEGCDQILTELDYARRYKKSLHKNDRFMLRHMLVIPALFETYHIVKNESKVTKRIDDLRFQAQRNDCYKNEANASSSFVPYQQSPQVSRESNAQRQSSSSSSGSKSLFSRLKNLF